MAICSQYSESISADKFYSAETVFTQQLVPFSTIRDSH